MPYHDEWERDGIVSREPVWHESYDVTSGAVAGHPAVPSPPDVVKAVEVLLGA